MRRTSLLVGWNEDAGRLGPKIADWLIGKLGGEEVAEIEPVGFFPLAGVSVEDDIARFPECRFYHCREHHLVICKSDPPRFAWHRFLNSILDAAESCCNAGELYAFGAMISLGPHTSPRDLLAVANSSQTIEMLGQYQLASDIDYETPPGQRPTLNSFLLWVAKRRGMPGASLWVPIPFYLVSAEDPRACKKVLEFFDERFNLGADFGELDEEVARQDRRIAQIRSQAPEIDRCMRKLEDNIALSHEENEKLVKAIEQLLKKK